jgi:hypothetical protein
MPPCIVCEFSNILRFDSLAAHFRRAEICPGVECYMKGSIQKRASIQLPNSIFERDHILQFIYINTNSNYHYLTFLRSDVDGAGP